MIQNPCLVSDDRDEYDEVNNYFEYEIESGVKREVTCASSFWPRENREGIGGGGGE